MLGLWFEKKKRTDGIDRQRVARSLVSSGREGRRNLPKKQKETLRIPGNGVHKNGSRKSVLGACRNREADIGLHRGGQGPSAWTGGGRSSTISERERGGCSH